MPPGSPRDTSSARAAHQAAAKVRAQRYEWVFRRHRHLSARQLAAELNDGYFKEPTPSGGGRWAASTVIRLRKVLGLMSHPEWDARYGKGAKRKQRERKAAAPVLTKAEELARGLRGLVLKDYDAAIAEIMDHPEPIDWPHGAVRYSARERCYIMRDGSAVRKTPPHTLLPASHDTMRRRRNYTRQLKEKDVASIYLPLTRIEAEELLGPAAIPAVAPDLPSSIRPVRTRR